MPGTSSSVKRRYFVCDLPLGVLFGLGFAVAWDGLGLGDCPSNSLLLTLRFGSTPRLGWKPV
jgi:hypothetical protein